MTHLLRGKNALILFCAVLWTAAAVLAVPIPLRTGSWPQILQSAALAAVLFISFAWIIQQAVQLRLPDSKAAAGNRWLPFGAALLCAAVWSVYGLVFRPGLISWDFFAQWQEMSGRAPRSDWHPFFHTALIWLLTRIWHSPAMITAAQILSMAAAAGMTARVLQRAGTPPWVIAAAALFYAFFPLNGFYAVSLWKDIGYSVSFLWLTALLVDILSSDGRRLARRGVLLQLFIALCCVAMMRHNGPVPAFAALAVLAALHWRSQLKSLLALGLAVAAAFVLFKGPVFDWLQVDVKSRRVTTAMLLVQHVGAILHDGWRPDRDDKEFLANILPLSYWKKAYQPRSCMPLQAGRDAQGRLFFNGAFLQEQDNYKRFLALWRRLAVRYPRSIGSYYAKATELVWRLHSPQGVFVLPDEGLTAADLNGSYAPSPPIKEKVGRLGNLLLNLLLGNPSADWLLYRGALFFWLSLGSITLTLLRSRRAAVLAAAAPLFFQTATVAAFPLVQDTRFMFPVILTAPVFAALFFSPSFSSPAAAQDAGPADAAGPVPQNPPLLP